MGTIIERKRKDGSIAYLAQIMMKRGGKVHRESKTFDRKPAARAWLERREKEMERPGAILGRAPRVPTLGAAIDRYLAESLAGVGRTKAQVLRAIKAHAIAGTACDAVGAPEIIAFARELAADVQPQTVMNYLSHLAAVFAIARPAWGYPLDERAMDDAMRVARRLGLVRKSAQRERRPTLDEMERIIGHFRGIRSRRRNSIPMAAITLVALFSTRRQDAILRITWSDLDEEGSRVLVRDMKHPGQKIGNHMWCDLPAEALAILRAMPRTPPRIFPFNKDAVSAAFTRACALLGIEDLHFHDLRHEGVSRLFEMGLNIPHVANVSGHRSWSSLKRYAHLRQAGDKYAGWAVLQDVLAATKLIG